MKYKEWLSEWLETYILPTVKRRTFDHYKMLVRKHIEPALGETELNELTAHGLQRFATGLLMSGNIKTGSGLSTSTVNLIITVMQGSLTDAYNAGELRQGGICKIRRPPKEERGVECFSLAEQRAIERYISERDKGSTYGIVIAMYTGLRIGELLALEWSDIDFTRGTLSVNKTCHYVSGEGRDERVVTPPKTKSSMRIIPLPRPLLVLMRKLRGRAKSQYVISNGTKPISIRAYQRTFEAILTRLRIVHHGFHSLRHTFATRALESGMDVKTLSELLGHNDASVTLNRYVHSQLEHKKEMMDKMMKTFK